MVQSTIKGALNEIERAIEAEVRSRPSAPEQPAGAAPRVGAPTLAMPDYVEHNDGATEIGKLSAEAVVREYEMAAKEIEAVGSELTELVGQCEKMTRNAFAVTEELKETARRYREEAKRVFLQIENCSQITAEVRKTCSELKEKLVMPSSAETRAKKK
jgi:hypothetical protein